MYCIIGMPAHHSLSPAIQNAAFLKHGIDAVFLAFDVPKERLEGAMLGMRAYGIKGMTLTSPHKENVIKYVDVVERQALELGAVNTVVNRKDKLYGYNTDSPGFVKALKKYGIKKDAIYTVIGAGGAARALVFGIAREGVKNINIVNRTVEHAEKLKKDIEERFRGLNLSVCKLGSEDMEKAVRSSKYLINATNITLENRTATPVPKNLLNKGMIVFDANYAPLDNRLLSDAKSKHCLTINGLELLVNQGIVAFELFTGRRFDYSETYRTMMSAAMKAYKESEKEKKK
ncbi:MAG: shikimate dehydrogenase [Candidatus Micrarchaeia archaeon]